MYLTDNGSFISANNLTAIAVTGFHDDKYYGGEVCTLMVCEDSVLNTYKAYIKPNSRKYPSVLGGVIQSNEDEKIASTMMYGDTFPIERAKEIFSNRIDFVEDGYFKDIKNRMAEYFI